MRRTSFFVILIAVTLLTAGSARNPGVFDACIPDSPPSVPPGGWEAARHDLSKSTLFTKFSRLKFLTFSSVFTAQAAYDFVSSSFLGDAGYDDAVVGARIRSDGTLVVAANLGPGAQTKLGVKNSRGNGCILLLSPDGTKVKAARYVASELMDLSLDRNDTMYVAAGDDGLLVLSSSAEKTLWRNPLSGCSRVDAAPDGHCAVVAGRTIHIFDGKGTALGTATGRQFTNDVCVDAASKTVIYCGFRNARSWEGRRVYPVQISYIYGVAYDGTRKWTNYDWSTDRDSDRFLNKPTNNMADSRADRCAIGRDGKLYVTYQVAGGNHIFRYSPKNIMEKVRLAGGDAHHQFHNSRAEHKNVFCRYDPATGAFLTGQQFCGRLSSGRANAVVTKRGEIAADEKGRVYVVGVSAYGIPLNLNPTGNDYRGGGFLLVMSPDFKTRLLCVCTAPGKGSPHTVDARRIGGKSRAVFGGSGMVRGMFVKNAIQGETADTGEGKKDPKDGFFAVVAPR